MSQPQSDQVHLRSGLAALFACIVQTLNEADPSVRPNFEKHLETLYRHLRDQAGDDLPTMELLSMTRDALKVLRNG